MLTHARCLITESTVTGWPGVSPGDHSNSTKPFVETLHICRRRRISLHKCARPHEIAVTALRTFVKKLNSNRLRQLKTVRTYEKPWTTLGSPPPLHPVSLPLPLPRSLTRPLDLSLFGNTFFFDRVPRNVRWKRTEVEER